MQVETDKIESNIDEDLKGIKLTKEEKENISKAVNRLFRMRAKKRLRTITNFITYPIYRKNI
jgi:hypothetical protein|tara:strand:+ start:178 stop:363 length:186 start_codon:yes stop_codon:yes gene_type:complete